MRTNLQKKFLSALSLLLLLKAAPVTAPFWQYIYDVTSFNNLFMCHVKIGLIILVAVIPKEGLAGTSAAKISFDVTLAIEWYSVIFYRLCFMDGVMVPATGCSFMLILKLEC